MLVILIIPGSHSKNSLLPSTDFSSIWIYYHLAEQKINEPFLNFQDFQKVLENFLSILKARIMNHHSVLKLVKFRDAFQELGLSSVFSPHFLSFLQTFFSALIQREKHVLCLCIIYETGKHNSFHLHDIILCYLHSTGGYFSWLYEHTGNGIVYINVEFSSDNTYTR